MSSVASPFGLKPAFHPSGILRQQQGTIASGFTSDIFQYSPVGIAADGTLVPVAPNAGANPLGAIQGVFLGVEWTATDGRRRVGNRWEANTVGTEIVAYFSSDTQMIYEIQADGSIAQSEVGNRFNWTALGGNTTTGLSNVAMSATPAAEGGLQVVGFNPAPDNAAGDAFTVCQVRIAKHQYVASIAAI